MGDFISGWRPKLGLLTLLMALVMMIGWLRSLRTNDIFLVNDMRTEHCLASERGFIIWSAEQPFHPKYLFSVKYSHDIFESIPGFTAQPQYIRIGGVYEMRWDSLTIKSPHSMPRPKLSS